MTLGQVLWRSVDDLKGLSTQVRKICLRNTHQTSQKKLLSLLGRDLFSIVYNREMYVIKFQCRQRVD